MGDGASFWIRGASLWIAKSETTSAVHVAFSCRDRQTVDAFFLAALRAGGKGNGQPGIRTDYHPALRGLRRRPGRQQRRSGVPRRIEHLARLDDGTALAF